jgi:hypothetical protein
MCARKMFCPQDEIAVMTVKCRRIPGVRHVTCMKTRNACQICGTETSWIDISWKIKGNNPVRAHGGTQCFETSRLPYFLDNRLTDGIEALSLMRQPPFTPHKDSWYSLPILYLSILLHYYTLYTIILFPSQCNLEKLTCILSFLTICFSPSLPSSGVSSYAKTVKLYYHFLTSHVP